MDNATVLCVEHLCTSFFTQNGEIKAVNDVSISVPRGRIIGIVGESGCGKSMTARSIMRLLHYPGRIVSGSIKLAGKELLELSEHEMSAVRGEEIGMIFQEPMTSLNPVMRVGLQVRETLLLHRKISTREAKAEVLRIFRKVGISEPERRYNCYPHELSGGLRQRVMIAMAMICRPKLVIADEPTTALDVTVEAQILQLMRALRDETGSGIVIISHNLGVIAQLCDYVYVMYAGRVVEQADTFDLFAHPMHPYTAFLMDAIPQADPHRRNQHRRVLMGEVPSPVNLPSGCCFHTRCPYATERCRTEVPELREWDGRMVACHRAGENWD